MSRPVPVVLIVLALLVGPALALPDALPPNAFPIPTLVDAGAPAVAGAWEAPFEGQIPAVHIALLPDGRVLYWSGDVAQKDQIYFFNTVEGSEVRALDPPYDAASVKLTLDPAGQTVNMFCAGHTILPDGRVLSAGGSAWHAVVTEPGESFVDGVVDARVYDWRTDEWSKVDDMSVPRWYPTIMTTQTGGLAVSGIDKLVDPSTHHASMEAFEDESWSLVENGNNTLPLYPRVLVVPSGPLKGQLYYETGGTLWGPFGEHPTEPLWNIAQAFDGSAWSFKEPSIFGARQSPNNVLLALDPANGYHARLLNFGGTLQRSIVATNTAEITDFSVDPPRHSLAAPLNFPRWQSTGILLPDGKVLAVGGAAYDNVMTFGTPDPAVMVAELYDPATNTWTNMASMTLAREYHGTALLLPDARVLVGGHVPNPVPWTAMRDNLPPANQSPQTKFEIFDPPYLHWATPRPTITSAPESISFGETFTVLTPDAATVKDAILVRNMAVTHSSDPGQRAVVLPIVATGSGSLTFEAPPDADLATPGAWMLFLRTQAPEGLVPSVAAMTMLG